MARKASAPKPEGESPATESAAGTITKAEAIRRALAEGLTKHEDAAPFIKTHFGHDVSPSHFAASKSREKPAEAGQPAPKRGRPPGKAKAVTVTIKRGRKPKAAPTAATPRATNGSTDLLAEMEALKPLVESMGKEKAHRIIELLG
jgi:hypothetical protein